MKSKLSYLEKIDYLSPLSKHEKFCLADTLTLKHLKQRQQAPNTIQVKRHLLLVKKGIIKICHLSPDGEEVILYLVGPNEFLNEGALFGIVDECYVVALEDCIICYCRIPDIKDLFAEHKDLEGYFIHQISRRLKTLEKRLVWFPKMTAEQKIKDFIQDYIIHFGERQGDRLIAQKYLNNGEIAQLTQTSRSTVSRVLNRLDREKVISIMDGLLRLNYPSHLECDKPLLI